MSQTTGDIILPFLPVITAIGGISPAGRSSCHQGFRRLVIDALPGEQRQRTLAALASLSGHDDQARLLDGTLIRRLETNLYDAARVPVNLGASSSEPLELEMRNIDLPSPLPEGWQVAPINGRRSRVRIPAGAELFVPASYNSRVQAAGQLPSGFNPGSLYPSRNHPRALQMAVYGASDALGMLGLPWESLRARLPPDQVAVYASNAMSQLDEAGLGGLFRYPASGKRITSKQVPLGLGEMTADFINAYVLGAAGGTGGTLGACATFLYNLSLGVRDIRSGRRRLVMVGTSEAPLVPEVIEGYRAMGALGEDEALLKLDPGRDTPDYRRACRPFGYNCGFTIAESAQFAILMDDELALELGADILGAVPDVFIHADGPKKSISAPGIGNYLTLGRAAALTRQLLGEDGLREHSYVHAHGTGTPQNRKTESHVLNETARAFGISDWPVAAIKCFVGHSLGSAGGDQLAAALGGFHDGRLPGIATVDEFAPDIHADRLSLSREHRQRHDLQAAFLNSKGFGGNNATALVLSPDATLQLLQRRFGENDLSQWRRRSDRTREQIHAYDEKAIAGNAAPVYRFGEGVLEGDDLEISDQRITIPGWDEDVNFEHDPDFDDYR